MKDIVKRVMEKDPMYPADITYPPKMILQGIEEAVKALKAGKKAADFPTTVVVDVPIEMITPENAKDFYFADSPY
jgi:ribose transport system substrate-binding protein